MATLEVRAENVGRPNTRKLEMLEVWFSGSTHCVSVTPSGWWFSTAGPRHKPDAYHCLGGARLKCVRLASVEYSNTVRDDSVTTKFEVRDVCVPLPESQETPTALCVDVVFVADVAANARNSASKQALFNSPEVQSVAHRATRIPHPRAVSGADRPDPESARHGIQRMGLGRSTP